MQHEREFQRDTSTPQGAVLCLEDAYRAEDVEACVAAKDFALEAQLMLERLFRGKDIPIDSALIGEAAATLEAAYRAGFGSGGFPDMSGVESFFAEPEVVSENVVLVTESCQHPDGTTTSQRLLVAKTANGWRVLNPVS